MEYIGAPDRFPEVKGIIEDGRQFIRAGDKTVLCSGYMSYFGTPGLYKQAGEAGIHLYCLPAYLGDRGINIHSGIGPFRKGIWTDEDAIDLTEPLEEGRNILEADPEAWIIMRLHLDPPLWWEEAHPEGCCRLSSGVTLRQSFFSPVWREAAADILKRVIGEFSCSDIAPRTAGIHIAAGNTEEWFYHFHRDRGFEDENPARTAAFRRWLQNRYGSDKVLQEAWNDTHAALKTVCPGDIKGSDTDASWIDPETGRRHFDTCMFHSESMADAIAFFCRTVKEASDRRLLTGAFYGYLYVQDPRRGHGALVRLLECPELDFLASPNTYNRSPGEDWLPMAPVDSVRMHGKLWFAENDTRTHCTSLLRDICPEAAPAGTYEDGVWLGPDDPWIAEQLLKKDAGRMLAFGYGGWWFDMWGGWFDDPRLMAVLQRHAECLREHAGTGPDGMKPRICIAADETAPFHDRSFGRLSGGIFRYRHALSLTGAQYRIILAADLSRVDDGEYPLVWIMGDIARDTEIEKQALRAAGPAGTVMHTDGTGTHIPGSSEAPRGKPRGIFAEPCEAKDAIPPCGKPQGFLAKKGEVLSPETGIECMAEKVMLLAERSGIHVYLRTQDVFYAGNGYVCIHAAEEGEKEIILPFSARVTDIFSGSVIAEKDDLFHVNLKQFETAVLKLERRNE